jgi:hypothetical protein
MALNKQNFFGVFESFASDINNFVGCIGMLGDVYL